MNDSSILENLAATKQDEKNDWAFVNNATDMGSRPFA